mgnify:CR=1 FL=1
MMRGHNTLLWRPRPRILRSFPLQKTLGGHIKEVTSHTTHPFTQKLSCDHSLQADELSLVLIAPANRPSLTFVSPAQKNDSLTTHHLPSLCLALVLLSFPTLLVSKSALPPCLSQHRKKSDLGDNNEDWVATCESSMRHHTQTPKK